MEQAGLRILGLEAWCYGSGFPKSLSLKRVFEKKGDMENSVKWAAWGSALKPAWEPIIVAEKP
jgi:site-specific DNA-methyltransferase (adenine-specific)